MKFLKMIREVREEHKLPRYLEGSKSATETRKLKAPVELKLEELSAYKLIEDEDIIMEDYISKVPKNIKKNHFQVSEDYFRIVKRSHMSAKRKLELELLRDNKE